MQRTQELDGIHNFTGTDGYHYVPMFKKIKYTDGVQYLAQSGSAYWLLDVCFSHAIPLIGKEDMMVCKLTVNDDNSALFVMTDGNENELARQEIEFTDFPAKTAEIWIEGDVALLPSEH